MNDNLIELFIFLIIVFFLFNAGVVISSFFIKKTDLVKKYKRGSLIMALVFFKLFLAFAFGVFYVTTQNMQTSSRVLLVFGLAFTAFNLSIIGWASLKLRREALVLQSKEVVS